MYKIRYKMRLNVNMIFAASVLIVCIGVNTISAVDIKDYREERDRIIKQTRNDIQKELLFIKKEGVSREKFEYNNYYDNVDSIIERINSIAANYSRVEGYQLDEMYNEIINYAGTMQTYAFYKKVLESRLPAISNEELFSCERATGEEIYNRGLDKIEKCDLYRFFRNFADTSGNVEWYKLKRYDEIIEKTKHDPYISFCVKYNERIKDFTQGNTKEEAQERRELFAALNSLEPKWQERYFRMQETEIKRMVIYIWDNYNYYIGKYQMYSPNQVEDSVIIKKCYEVLTAEEIQVFIRNFFTLKMEKYLCDSEEKTTNTVNILQKVLAMGEERYRNTHQQKIRR